MSRASPSGRALRLRRQAMLGPSGHDPSRGTGRGQLRSPPAEGEANAPPGAEAEADQFAFGTWRVHLRCIRHLRQTSSAPPPVRPCRLFVSEVNHSFFKTVTEAKK